TAVRFRDESTLRERWLVFEPDDASMERNEESTTGPLLSRLHGHKVGDTVLIASGATQDRVVSILEIVDNITYRFRDSLDEWQVRFPEEPGFEKVQLTRSDGPSENNDVDFEPLLRVARERQASLEELDSAYRTMPMPIFMLSEVHGSEVEAWAHVVRTATLPIRCCVGSPDEWIDAAKAMRGCRAVVLDIGAVLAVDWLELRDVFAAWPVDRLLTPATFQMLRARQTQLERSSVNARDHAAAAAAEHMSDLLQFLADTCEQSDVPELAALPSETRDEFLKLLGPSSTESIAAATRPGHLLWSDQVAVGLLGRKALGVAHGWTQAVVHGRHAIGALDAERLAGIDARLLALRYESTRFDARAIVASAVAAGWDANGFPFKQNLDELVGEGAMVYERFWVLTGAIVSLCTEAATSEVRTRVIVSILDRIATRPAGFAVVRALRRSIRPAFGINHLRADEADEVIVGWLVVHQRLDAE
ncbi:MAG: hypothetical protein KC492_09860, partial [Myxococcales bacterium]|nr:hypothetical protein [Myxococcales bacterium]